MNTHADRYVCQLKWRSWLGELAIGHKNMDIKHFLTMAGIAIVIVVVNYFLWDFIFKVISLIKI